MVGLSTACVCCVKLETFFHTKPGNRTFQIDKINVQRNYLSKCIMMHIWVSEDHRAFFFFYGVIGIGLLL